MKRRSLLAAPLAAFPLSAGANDDARVFAVGDGLNLTPAEYARVLAGLGEIPLDDYSRGGVVERLEAKMAGLLGKEAAIWMPTGTLANQIAVRTRYRRPPCCRSGGKPFV